MQTVKLVPIHSEVTLEMVHRSDQIVRPLMKLRRTDNFLICEPIGGEPVRIRLSPIVMTRELTGGTHRGIAMDVELFNNTVFYLVQTADGKLEVLSPRISINKVVGYHELGWLTEYSKKAFADFVSS